MKSLTIRILTMEFITNLLTKINLKSARTRMRLIIGRLGSKKGLGMTYTVKFQIKY